MTPIVQAVLKAGLLSSDQLAEFKHFRTVTIPPDAETCEPAELEEAAKLISTALQSEGFVLVRETDLAVVSNFLRSSKEGQLHVETLEGGKDDIGIRFCVTSLGEYVIPWNGEGIADLLVNGMTYLLDGAYAVTFSGVRELFFGQHKAFVVCTPREKLQVVA